MTTTPAAPALLEEIQGQQAWGVIRLKDSDTVTLVGGPLHEYDALTDVPLREGKPEEGRRFDHLLAVPFRQVAERGFVAVDDGAPLAAIEVAVEHEVPLAELLAALPDVPVEFSDKGGFETDDASYAETVRRILADEIGNGEGANLVIGRKWLAQLAA